MHRQTAETGVEAASLWPRLEAGVGAEAEAEARGESRVKNMFGYNSSFMFFVACLLHIPCSYKGSSTGCISWEWKTMNWFFLLKLAMIPLYSKLKYYGHFIFSSNLYRVFLKSSGLLLVFLLLLLLFILSLGFALLAFWIRSFKCICKILFASPPPTPSPYLVVVQRWRWQRSVRPETPAATPAVVVRDFNEALKKHKWK